MNIKKILVSAALLFTSMLFNFSNACTNFLITKGASKDGSTMISYAADSHTLYGELYYRPAADYPLGAMVDVTEWDTGRKLGKIKQAAHTYSVVGNMNEHQLVIGETTFGGLPELQDTTAIIDYGTLIYTTLQRAKTAREAIKVMCELTNEYGFCSAGESFSIADKEEVWILEMVGKGKRIMNAKGQVDVKKWSKSPVWVALRIPDGYISGHANHARITTFPLANGKTSITSKDINKITNPEVECVYAYDAISYAKNLELFAGKDVEFSFSDIYCPLDFSGARGCEARVWAGFMRANPEAVKGYEAYARGEDLTKRMPLWIKPAQKISVQDVMAMMRDHYEGTSMDMTKDKGAGPYTCPYRWRPMSWEYQGKKYLHERATATQQTGFSFVSQSRNWLPDPIGGIFWFGVDDAATSCYVPMYCGITEIPLCFREGNGNMLTYSPTSAFWLFNQVSNFAYLRYSDIAPDVIKVQKNLEDGFVTKIAQNDEKWAKENNMNVLVDNANAFSNTQANIMFTAWKKLYEYVLVKYIDGNIKKEQDGKFQNNGFSDKQPAFPMQPAYPEWFYGIIVDDAGDNLKVIEKK